MFSTLRSTSDKLMHKKNGCRQIVHSYITMRHKCFVLFYALCFICENSDNAPSKSSSVYAGGSHVLHRRDKRPTAECYKTKLRYSDCCDVLLLMCQNKPTTKLFHSSRQLHRCNWAHIYLYALIICTFSSAGMLEFREIFSKAKHIAIITGAGVSAESGVPTFRGENEKWRKWLSQVLEKQTNKKTLIWVRRSFCILPPASVTVGCNKMYLQERFD